MTDRNPVPPAGNAVPVAEAPGLGSTLPPLVSVIVPAYNAERWIAETLGSVLGQEHQELDVVVVDDGSTDATASVVRAIGERDSRVRLLSFPNGGLACARNRGLRAARGEFVAFLDADDLWHPEKLRLQLSALKGRTMSVALCGIRRFREGSRGREWTFETLPPPVRDGAEGIRDVLLLRNDQMAIFTTALFRTAELRAIGGFAEGILSAEDWELWLRCGGRLSSVPVARSLYFYRKHGASLTARARLESVLSLQVSLIQRERSAGNVGPRDASLAIREKIAEFARAAEWNRDGWLAARLVLRGLLRYGGVSSVRYLREAAATTVRAAVRVGVRPFRGGTY